MTTHSTAVSSGIAISLRLSSVSLNVRARLWVGIAMVTDLVKPRSSASPQLQS